jgi:hypothetical protein
MHAFSSRAALQAWTCMDTTSHCSTFLPFPSVTAPKEYKISLAVECDSAAPPKLRVLVKEAAQHATDAAAQPCAKAIQQQLWAVSTGPTMTLRPHRRNKWRPVSITHRRTMRVAIVCAAIGVQHGIQQQQWATWGEMGVAALREDRRDN